MTKVLAITSYSGHIKYSAMTKAMLLSLWDTKPSFVDMKVSATTHETDISMKDTGLVNWETAMDDNSYFACKFNRSIECGQSFNPDYVMIVHNDMLFKNDDWMVQLIFEAGPDRVTVAVNDGSLSHMYPHAVDEPPFRIQAIAAHNWLIPFSWCQFLKREYGFWLFDESFNSCYGEDDWTCYLFSKHFGKNPFRIVPRSWVRHYKAVTAKHLGLDTRDNRRAGRLELIRKMKVEMKDRSLRKDLREWCHRMIIQE